MVKDPSEMSGCVETAPLERLQQRLSEITHSSTSSGSGATADPLLSAAQEDNPALLRLQNRLRYSAMNLLARREHSRLELQTKLTNKRKFHLQQAYKLILEKGEERFIPAVASDIEVSGCLDSYQTGCSSSTSAVSSESNLSAEPDIGYESSGCKNPNKIADIDYALAWLGDRFSGLLDAVLTRLEVDDLLDDQRFAESYLRSRSRAGFGPVRIKSELKQRGVTIVPQQMHEIDWFELILDVRSKKFGVALPNDLKGKAKQIQFLSYRGFPKDLINNLFII